MLLKLQQARFTCRSRSWAFAHQRVGLTLDLRARNSWRLAQAKLQKVNQRFALQGWSEVHEGCSEQEVSVRPGGLLAHYHAAMPSPSWSFHV